MKFITWIVVTLTIALMDISLSFSNSNILINPPSDWVEIIKPPLDSQVHPDATDIHYLLYDRQVRVTGTKEQYFRMTYRLLNETSVEENGQQYFDFSPDFQTLTLHNFKVIRDGNIVNQLSKILIKVIQREQDAEKLTFDGRLSAFFILEDLRKNDIIDYSYTIKGRNPALKDAFYNNVHLEWATPVEKLSYRLLWPKDKAINYKSINTDLTPKVSEGIEFTEYKISDKQTDTIHIDQETPSWFNPKGRITFSNQNSWEEVVNWALPLYTPKTSNDALKIVNNIKEQSNSKHKQLSLALQFTQNEIRYLGIQIGQGSFIPSDINTTLEKRYADCKGKTLLLLSLMHSLGIEGYAALVNTDTGKNLHVNGIRATAFDHVIVKAIIDNKTYWIDPTKTNQLPDINALFQSDYGQALVVKQGNNNLEDMNVTGANKKVIHETIDISAGLSEFSSFNIESQNFGLSAEQLKQELASNTGKQLQSTYLNFYNRFYPGLEPDSNHEIEVVENNIDHSIKTIENYHIKEAWKKNNSRHEIDFYANSINHLLDEPKKTIRNSPYALIHPVDITHIIEVKLHNNNWDISNEFYENTSDFFDFSRNIIFDNKTNVLTQTYHYQSKADHVPLDKMNNYLAELDDAYSRYSFGLYSSFENNSTPLPVFTFYNLLVSFLVISFIAIMYSFYSLVREKEIIDENDLYYPVSFIKFSILSFLTLGLYISYWFYKNWQYVKRNEASKIMPIGRAIFSILWFYPLLTRLRNLSENTILTHWSTAVLMALIFIAGMIISNSESMIIATLGIGLETISALYLVYIVNNLNLNQTETFKRNSKWRARHIASGIPLTIIILFSVASEVALIPPPYVFSGDMLWRNDIQFLQRHGILDFDEKVDKFYSSDFISFEKDGNGLTDRQVFSYWKDSEGVTYSESAIFQDIAKINVSNGSLTEDTTVKVTRNDNSSFILYLPSEDKGENTFIELLRKRSNLPSLETDI
jgi:hypothetical protein